MKIMSMGDRVFVDCFLRTAADKLERSIKKMKGKYGTSYAVSHLEFALENVRDIFSDKKVDIEFYQKFTKPPNTPKSRRLGWYGEGVRKEK